MNSTRHALLAAARGERIAPPDAATVAAAKREGMLGLVARAAEPRSRELEIELAALESHAALMSGALGRIAAAFRTAGVRLVAYKGAVASLQLYGDPALRSFSDLDLLVSPEDAAAGERILRELGYVEVSPVAPSMRATHRRFNCETLFVDRSTGVLVDFHWNLSHVQFPLGLRFDDLWMRRAKVILAGEEIAAPGTSDLAVITCAHAAKHLWYRLELLAQIAALVRLETDWGEVDRIAASAHALRQVGLSFLLAESILGVAPPSLPGAIAAARPWFDRVRRRVERALFAEGDRKTDAAGGDHFLLLDRRRDALRSVVYSVIVPKESDWAGSSLPGWMHWVARPVRLVLRKIGGRE